MIIGESLVAPCVAYSPWFEAHGGAAAFVCETLNVARVGDEDPGGNLISELVLSVETKGLNEADDQATTLVSVDGQWSTTQRGEVYARFEGFRELVRFKYTVNLGAFDLWVIHFRMLPPSWQDNLSARTIEEVLESQSNSVFPVKREHCSGG